MDPIQIQHLGEMCHSSSNLTAIQHAGGDGGRCWYSTHKNNLAQEITGSADTRFAGETTWTLVPRRNTLVGGTQQGDFYCIPFGQAEARGKIMHPLLHWQSLGKAHIPAYRY